MHIKAICMYIKCIYIYITSYCGEHQSSDC